MKSAAACLIVLLLNLPAFAGPRVDIVIGEKAPALERLAADELAGQLKRVYEADVKIGSTAPADALHVIFVGSPETNASMEPFVKSWPSGDKKLSDQGHLLRSVTHNSKPALLIGGGSPVATYWAVAEFGHHLGIRSMLFGDLDPIGMSDFKLDGINITIEPIVRSRGWFFWNSHQKNDGAWGIDEYRRFIRQLANLRFNQITVNLPANQPYLHFEYENIKRTSASVLPSIDVSGDTAGRKAFGGEKRFDPPAFVGATIYSEQHEAAKKHLRGIIDAAHEFGMSIHVHFALEHLPPECAPLLSSLTKAKSGSFDRSAYMLLNWKALTGDATVTNIFRAHVRSLIETYSNLDGFRVFPPTVDSSEEIDVLRKFFSHPGLLRRADGRNVRVTCLGVSDAPVGLVVKPLEPAKGEDSHGQISEINFGKYPTMGLPRIRPQSWEEQWNAITKQGSRGFEVNSSHVGDDDLPAYWISRVSLGEKITPQMACRGLLAPVSGEEIDQRVWRSLELMEKASMRFGDASVTPETIGIVLSDRLFASDEPPPAEWNEIRDNYLNAMNEMYRANTRARDGGRGFTLYLARRFEFAFEYMNCIDSIRKSVIAESKKDIATQIAEMEKAIESLNNGLNAMAAVARSNSDRGLIAVLNESGYRPLKKKLAEAEAAAK